MHPFILYSLEAYSSGVNDLVDSMDVFPIEFYMLMTAGDFEPWLPEDSVCLQVLMQYFVSFDWFLEVTRQRLTEIYDKELVDRMLPFKAEDYFWKNTECKWWMCILIADGTICADDVPTNHIN